MKCTNLCKCEGCKNGNCLSDHDTESGEEMYNEFEEFYNGIRNKKIKTDLNEQATMESD